VAGNGLRVVVAEQPSLGDADVDFRAAGVGSIVLTGLVDTDGALSNSGSGYGTTTISGVIGTHVTGVIQDSATSKLVLAGTNTYTGNTTVAEGELIISGNGLQLTFTAVPEPGTWAVAALLVAAATAVTLKRPKRM